MLAERAQYGVSITPRSGGDRSVGKLMPVHNPQMRAPDISTTQAVARKAAETPSLGGRKLAEALPRRARRVSEVLSYRIAWAEGWCRQVDGGTTCKHRETEPKIDDAGFQLDRCEWVPSNIKKQSRTHRRCATGAPACTARLLIGANMLQAALRSYRCIAGQTVR
jgi:hypothetical protein